MPGQKFGPAWFPGLIAGGLGICGVLLIAGGLRQRSPWAEVPGWVRSPRARAGVAALVGGLLFYVFAADALGFHLTGVLLLTLWMRLLGASWRVTLPVALIATLLIHFSFYKLLRIPLPWGVLESFAF
jgi:putative tricarboxylic transport membrane protein